MFKTYSVTVEKGGKNTQYEIYDFDWESREIDPVKVAGDWIRETGELPKEKYLILANRGKIPVLDIDTFLSAKEKTSDLVRTNVTISAPLFEWAKVKAKKESTSFSDLVTRGLLMLKESSKEARLWFREQRAFFQDKLGDHGFLEVTHYLPNSYEVFEIDRLKKALQDSAIRRTGWPIGVYLRGENRPNPREDGIRAVHSQTRHLILDYWYAKTSGDFYFARNLPSDNGLGSAKPGTMLYFDTLVWRVTEALEHCISLYKELGVLPPEKVNIKLSTHGISGRGISAWNPGRSFTLSQNYKAEVDKSSWEIEISLEELESNIDSLVYEAVKKILIMFDFFVPNENVVQEIIEKEYRKSSM